MNLAAVRFGHSAIDDSRKDLGLSTIPDRRC
jgi:hypothetical protein